MSVRRSIGALAVTVLVAMVLSVFQAVPASAASAGDFSSRINSLRASKGLGALSVNGSLASQAQGWAQQMANKNAISHNPNLGGTPGNWTKVGENVGTGGTVSAIFDALVASPSHYRNMVDGSFNSVGIGVAMGSDGRIYTCHVFAAFPSAAAAKPAAAPAKPAATSTTAKAPATTAAKPKQTSTTAAKPATTTTAAPANTNAASAPTTPVAPAPPVEAEKPAPSERIVIALTELESISTQG